MFLLRSNDAVGHSQAVILQICGPASQPFDFLDGDRRTAPPQELKLLVLERVRGKEESLQLLVRTRRKAATCWSAQNHGREFPFL